MQSNVVTFSLHSSPWWLSHYTWKLGSWLSSLKTGLVGPSHPHSKRVKADSVTSQQMRSETKLVELAANIKSTFFFLESSFCHRPSFQKSRENFNAFLGCWLWAHRVNSTCDCSQFRKCLEKGSRKKLEFSHNHTNPRATALTPPVSHLIKCLAILVFVIIFRAVYTKKVPRKPE